MRARASGFIEADAADQSALTGADRGQAYTKSLTYWRQLVEQNPTDTQARIFLALATGMGSKEGVLILEGVLKTDPKNSAANHYFIHAVEGSSHPEQALHSAEILASLAPASGHMVHMPGHIYFRLGDYARAQEAFDASMRVDEAYMREQHVAVDNDWNYVHNLMYAVANLLEEGKLKQAAEISRKLIGARGELDSTLYPFSARDSISRVGPDLPVALRTANWPQVIALSQAKAPPASDPNLRFLARELALYGTGMQAAEARNVKAADSASSQFDAGLWRMTQQIRDEPRASKDPKDSMERAPAAGPKSPPPPQKVTPPRIPVMSDAEIEPLFSVLSVMSLELRGGVLELEQQTAEAKAVFARAAREETELGYHEPPLYIRPAAEAEASALMAAGDFSAAKAAYQAALLERPHSGFPLYGIALSSEKSGNLDDAAKEYRDFLAAWKNADPDLPQIAHAHAFLERHP
ncbi:MAG TPA: hypothetical protein VHX11_01035 [Acidobacteriaceae bacterium]|nr:hypothetical protein [Acidobacteriaceae bacterium]